jgi:hypothetical protein
MKKSHHFISSAVAIVIIAFPMTSNADLCKTHETCSIGNSCQCTIGADGAYGRYFYFDFPEIHKGHIYNCNFSSKPALFTIVPEASTFPPGVTYSPSGNYPRFPLTLMIDTQKMVSNKDTMIIKYYVPGSDIPNNITASCELTS